jgi:hypothetical protein
VEGRTGQVWTGGCLRSAGLHSLRAAEMHGCRSSPGPVARSPLICCREYFFFFFFLNLSLHFSSLRSKYLQSLFREQKADATKFRCLVCVSSKYIFHESRYIMSCYLNQLLLGDYKTSYTCRQFYTQYTCTACNEKITSL